MIGLGLYSCQEQLPPLSMSPSLNPDDFRDACAQFATGVAVATVTAPDGSPHGLTVSSFISVSIHPPFNSDLHRPRLHDLDPFSGESFLCRERIER